MSEPSSLMTEFQKLRVETSKIQNEFREKPGYVEDKLHKNTLEMCQKILKKQHGFQKTQENQNKFIEHLILDLESVKKETSDMKKQQETQILKRQDEYHDEMKQEFQKIQATQNKLIEDLMSELKTVKNETNDMKRNLRRNR
ncbi:Ubiquitin-like domain-containing protein [Caenorhabditis elegans]|uniref:Ubiquitin-like domain-containing protein n=1 Tax=Caenorhabditis elegans TaxID=6239 RepID=P91052_CAEEL|nr:Ubiquitin-like domain-containing protein [Caenorhabditis elegans]CCD64703.2 Ubiquitin-like domain-containing protein [Caenorhabditis elegans]